MLTALALRPRLALAVIAGGLAGSAVAHGEPAPTSTVVRIGAAPLAPGHGWLAATYELSLSTRAVGAPWALALDGALAVHPRLTVGLSQSAAALGTVDRSGGVCLTSVAHTCPRRWRGALIDVRWRIRDGDRAVTALARFGISGLGPIRPVVRLGGRAAARRGPWWIVGQPEFGISLGHTELGNRSTFEAPVWLGRDLGLAGIWLRTGVRGELAGFDEKFEIPIGLGVAWTRGSLRAGLDAGWPQLLGPQNAFKQRQAAVWIAIER